MDWVRLYHDMPTDPKWRVIAKKADQRIGDVIAVFMFVLTNASSNTVKRGETQGLVAEDIAAAIDLEEASVTAILGAMEGKVLKNGILLGWEKRNPKREDSSTERVKKHRETQRNALERPDKTRKDEIRIEESNIASLATLSAKPPRRASTTIPGNFPDPEAISAACDYWDSRDRNDLTVTAQDEVGRFRAHHTSHGKRMADWGQAWVTWYSNAIKFNRKPDNGNRSNKPSAHDKFLSASKSLIGDFLGPSESCDDSGFADQTGRPLLPARLHGGDG